MEYAKTTTSLASWNNISELENALNERLASIERATADCWSMLRETNMDTERYLDIHAQIRQLRDEKVHECDRHAKYRALKPILLVNMAACNELTTHAKQALERLEALQNEKNSTVQIAAVIRVDYMSKALEMLDARKKLEEAIRENTILFLNLRSERAANMRAIQIMLDEFRM
jgi:hypothetical protein